MKGHLLRPVSFLDIFIRFFSGFGAGLSGAIIMLIVLFLSWSIVGDTLAPKDVALNEFGVAIETQSTHPLFAYFVVLAAFLGIIASNIAYILIATFISEYYSFRTTLLTDVFFGNLIILILMIPVYVVMTNYFGNDGIGIASFMHVILSVILSFFTLEIINWSKHLLVNLYGFILGIICFVLVSLVFYSNKTALAFFVLPLLFGFLAMGNAMAQSIYEWFYKTYGNDFLNIETRFGEDYGKK